MCCPRARTAVLAKRDKTLVVNQVCKCYGCQHCGDVRRQEKQDRAAKLLVPGTEWRRTIFSDHHDRETFIRLLSYHGLQYVLIVTKTAGYVFHQPLPNSARRSVASVRMNWRDALLSFKVLLKDVQHVHFSRRVPVSHRPKSGWEVVARTRVPVRTIVQYVREQFGWSLVEGQARPFSWIAGLFGTLLPIGDVVCKYLESKDRQNPPEAPRTGRAWCCGESWSDDFAPAY